VENKNLSEISKMLQSDEIREMLGGIARPEENEVH
jgi:hypothetical protein